MFKFLKSTFRRIHREMMNVVNVFAFAPENVSVTESSPLLSSVFTVFKERTEVINGLAAEVALPITGNAVQKGLAKTDVIYHGLGLLGSLANFALSKNDQVMYAQVSQYSRSGLEALPGGTLAGYMQEIINMANALPPDELAPFAITPALISSFQLKVSALALLSSSPAAAIALRKARNTDLKEKMIEAMMMLYNQVDPAVQTVRISHPLYFNNYRNARRLRPNGHVITKIRAMVTDEINQPVRGVIVLVNELGLTVNTDAQGEALLHVPFGTYTLTLTSGEQSITSPPVKAKKGQSVTIHFTMAPSGFVIPDFHPAYTYDPVEMDGPPGPSPDPAPEDSNALQ